MELIDYYNLLPKFTVRWIEGIYVYNAYKTHTIIQASSKLEDFFLIEGTQLKALITYCIIEL